MLAQIPNLTQDQTGVWVIGLIALIVVVSQIVGIWANVRRRPSIEMEIETRVSAHCAALEARMKAEIETTSTRLDAKIAEVRTDMMRLNQDRRVNIASLFTKVDQMQSSINQTLSDMDHTLGKLEATVGGIAKAQETFTTQCSARMASGNC